MNRKLLIAVSLFLLAFCSCRNKSVYSNIAGFAQGSTYSIVYENRRNADPGEYKQGIEKILASFDSSLSLYNDSSILCRINRNEAVAVDSFFAEAFRKSAMISQLTGGAFDITVGPLVRAWGFTPGEHKPPTSEKIDSLKMLVGMDKVSLVNGHLIKKDPNIKLDFNAIAQGYSVDLVCRYFDKLGIKNYLVEIGGEVRAKGRKAGKLWRIGIDKPVDDNMNPGENLEAIIRISDKSLSTSGNYRKFYIENGVKYSHEIDPKTGYPARNTLLSVSIIASDCASADGISTACMVMGKDKSIEFLASHPELDGYLIYSDEKGNFITWTTDNLKNEISEISDK